MEGDGTRTLEVADLEFVEGLEGVRPPNVNMLDKVSHRAGAQIVEELRQRALVAFGHQFDPAVAQVLDPSDNRPLARRLFGSHPKTDALDPAGIKHMDVLFGTRPTGSLRSAGSSSTHYALTRRLCHCVILRRNPLNPARLRKTSGREALALFARQLASCRPSAAPKVLAPR